MSRQANVSLGRVAVRRSGRWLLGLPDRVVNLFLTMSQPLKTVAVLVANPALSSILSTTLAAAPGLRVRPFETEEALRAYLKLAPELSTVTWIARQDFAKQNAGVLADFRAALDEALRLLR